jgi:glycosyltransferase involved in cell wall biosynthesis
MKFSFILCTRNSERVLAEVVESIVSQKIDHKLIEIILADYESSDQTIEIVKVISKKYQIKFNYIECHKSGKTPSLEKALDFANGDYSVIVDDDNVLDRNYIEEAEKLLIDPNLGCVGSQGVVDKNLFLPDWFNEYKGNYAIGVPLGANDWVWGACSIINMIAWKKLRKKGFEIQLNAERTNHSYPVELGGEDTELSLAIHMIGYKVKFAEQLKFIHKFDQKRLNQKYLLENVFGTCRSIPVLEIYRLIIYKSNSLFPKTIWILVLFKIIIRCIVRFMINILTIKLLKAKHKYAIILGIISGFIYFRKNFNRIYNKLIQIKKLTSSS